MSRRRHLGISASPSCYVVAHARYRAASKRRQIDSARCGGSGMPQHHARAAFEREAGGSGEPIGSAGSGDGVAARGAGERAHRCIEGGAEAEKADALMRTWRRGLNRLNSICYVTRCGCWRSLLMLMR